jgi:hypothetical protein
MLVVSALNASIFWGGWLPPLNIFPLNAVPGFIWFVIKVMMGIFFYTWLRATLPRLRYDALMSLGWKRMLPIGLVWLFVVAGYSLIRETKFPPLIPNPNRQTAPISAQSETGMQPPVTVAPITPPRRLSALQVSTADEKGRIIHATIPTRDPGIALDNQR